MKMKAFLLCLGVLSLVMCCSMYAGKGKKGGGQRPRYGQSLANWEEEQRLKKAQGSSASQTSPTLNTEVLPTLPQDAPKLEDEQEESGDEAETAKQEKSDDETETVEQEEQPKEPEVQQPGWSWSLSSRKSRVMFALTRPTDPQSRGYLRQNDGQDARHEIGRELKEAMNLLQAEGLTERTDALVTIQTILAKSRELGIEINLAELKAAWQKVKDTKTGVTGNLNGRLQVLRDTFMQAANAEFKKEADLIASLAQTQHTAAAMRTARSDDPGNTSDTEGKPWDLSQVFEVLSHVNQPKLDGTLGVAISLQPTAPEEEEKD